MESEQRLGRPIYRCNTLMTSYSPKHATMASSGNYRWLQLKMWKDEKTEGVLGIRFTETYVSSNGISTTHSRNIPMDNVLPYIWTCYRLFVFKSQDNKKPKNIIPPFFIDSDFRKGVNKKLELLADKQFSLDNFNQLLNQKKPSNQFVLKDGETMSEVMEEIPLVYEQLMNMIFDTSETVNSRIVTQQEEGRPLHLDPSSLKAGESFESKDDILKAIYKNDYGLASDEEMKHNRFNSSGAQMVEKKPAKLYEIVFRKNDRQWQGGIPFENKEFFMDAPIRGQAVTFNKYSIWAQAQPRLPWHYALAYFRFHIYVLRDMYMSSGIPEQAFQILIDRVQDPILKVVDPPNNDEISLNTNLKRFFEYLPMNGGYKDIMQRTPEPGQFLMPMTKSTPYVEPRHIYDAFIVERNDASNIKNTVLYQQIQKYFNKDDTIERFFGVYRVGLIRSLNEKLGERQAEIDDLAVRLTAVQEELKQLQTSRHYLYSDLRTSVDLALKDANLIRALLVTYAKTGNLDKGEVLAKIDVLMSRFNKHSFGAATGSTKTPYNEQGQGKRKSKNQEDGLNDPKIPRGSDESDQAGSAARIKSGVKLIMTAAKAFEKIMQAHIGPGAEDGTTENNQGLFSPTLLFQKLAEFKSIIENQDYTEEDKVQQLKTKVALEIENPTLENFTVFIAYFEDYGQDIYQDIERKFPTQLFDFTKLLNVLQGYKGTYYERRDIADEIPPRKIPFTSLWDMLKPITFGTEKIGQLSEKILDDLLLYRIDEALLRMFQEKVPENINDDVVKSYVIDIAVKLSRAPKAYFANETGIQEITEQLFDHIPVIPQYVEPHSSGKKDKGKRKRLNGNTKRKPNRKKKADKFIVQQNEIEKFQNIANEIDTFLSNTYDNLSQDKAEAFREKIAPFEDRIEQMKKTYNSVVEKSDLTSYDFAQAYLQVTNLRQQLFQVVDTWWRRQENINEERQQAHDAAAQQWIKNEFIMNNDLAHTIGNELGIIQSYARIFTQEDVQTLSNLQSKYDYIVTLGKQVGNYNYTYEGVSALTRFLEEFSNEFYEFDKHLAEKYNKFHHDFYKAKIDANLRNRFEDIDENTTLDSDELQEYLEYLATEAQLMVDSLRLFLKRQSSEYDEEVEEAVDEEVEEQVDSEPMINAYVGALGEPYYTFPILEALIFGNELLEKQLKFAGNARDAYYRLFVEEIQKHYGNLFSIFKETILFEDEDKMFNRVLTDWSRFKAKELKNTDDLGFEQIRKIKENMKVFVNQMSELIQTYEVETFIEDNEFSNEEALEQAKKLMRMFNKLQRSLQPGFAIDAKKVVGKLRSEINKLI